MSVDGITQDEPVRGPGQGSGHTCPDGVRMDADSDGNPETAALRCERDGTGNGRVYTVQFTATDDKGLSCSSSLTFCVPHDQGQLLMTGRSNGHDQPAAGRQLFKQFLGQFRGRCRYDNPVIRAVFWPALPTITAAKPDVVDVQFTQSLLRFPQ